MRKRITAALVLLAVSTAIFADESPYNKGVDAWRSKNYAEARKQWERSLAEGGPDEALNNLAFLLYNGLGGETDPTKAVELWRKGAALAVSEAQLHLGQAYEAGRGVARSRTQALAWYLCAVASASKLSGAEPTERAIEQDARSAETKLHRILSEVELVEAKRTAEQLIAKYSSRLATTKP
jgi:TPR repeat protein